MSPAAILSLHNPTRKTCSNRIHKHARCHTRDHEVRSCYADPKTTHMKFMSMVPDGSVAMTCSSSWVLGIFSFLFLLVDSQACIAFISRYDARATFTSSVVLGGGGGGTKRGGEEWEAARGCNSSSEKLRSGGGRGGGRLECRRCPRRTDRVKRREETPEPTASQALSRDFARMDEKERK